MELMEQKIRAEGKVLPGGILKVGSFLNQQIDTAFLTSVGREIARLYDGCGVTKVLTIESSGIAIAAAWIAWPATKRELLTSRTLSSGRLAFIRIMIGLVSPLFVVTVALGSL